ncbi:MAG: hypothetical protein CL927_15250 [Deltaproteobacteria bacterium]|nr:hypothetical protein [Deltaproteobacteria bacterium]HCH61945.1 hypothetical protein [Deltaproteobacteria bacterium]
MKRFAPHLVSFGLVACGSSAPSSSREPQTRIDPTIEAEVENRTERFEIGGGMDAGQIAAFEPVLPKRDGRTPTPLPAEDRYKSTAAFLEQVVRQRAAEPDNPWAIGHGLVAVGKDLVLSNGKPAVDHVFESYAERFEVDGHAFVRFPRKKGTVRVEPHAALMLKAFTEAGVSPNRTVTVQGAPATVADLYRGVLISAAVDPASGKSTFSSPNDMPWALQALATWAPPNDDLHWEAINGTVMSLDDFAMLNASVLLAESQPLFDTIQAGAALEKRGQGVFKFTCGGAHLLQGTAYAIGRGHTTALGQKGIQGQVVLMFWRLPAELKIYDDLMKRIDKEEHMVLLLVQRLKFTGHFLETMHKMAILGLYTPSPSQQQMLTGAADQVSLTVKALQSRGVFDRLDEIRAQNEQLYLDIVGDSAHALRGLRLAMGTDGLQY